MNCLLALSLVTVTAPSHAQAPSSQQVVEFAIGLAFQDNVFEALQSRCTTYKPSLPSNGAFIAELRKASKEISAALDPVLKATKLVAQAHAAQLVINAEGCETPGFKKTAEQVEEQQAMLALRVMQGQIR
ncbi:hypothetical protein RQP53_24265 [Paucibacter sp. APW11]|uniref:Uncharacterized protein n=1 Tax=Roseateles aquae TaxID=3077235 RepID=A0ABU3PIQ9_9BURK|nr:hypothetical protein [Paucibacter sp. APW11]MDT9002418.1 hypothetical protein [Paucibacter sp. APW11]